MKPILFIIALVAMAAGGQNLTPSDGAYVGASRPAVAVSSSTPDLLVEKFEGTGYDNSNSITFIEDGSVDEDFSTSGLSMEGSQCVKLNCVSANSDIISGNLTAGVDTVYAYFLFRTTFMPAGIANVFFIRSGFDSALELSILSTGALGIREGTGTRTYTTATLSVDTTYHVWVKRVKGSGANGLATVAFSTDGTKPTSGTAYAECTDGNASVQARTVWALCIKDTNDGSSYFDKLLVSTTEIGSNP